MSGPRDEYRVIQEPSRRSGFEIQNPVVGVVVERRGGRVRRGPWVLGAAGHAVAWIVGVLRNRERRRQEILDVIHAEL
jgi:hypothetical protein